MRTASESRTWYVRSTDGSVYGPAAPSTLLQWVKEGRVEPVGYVSEDRVTWTPPQLLDWLEMRWLVEIAPGKVCGPFHRDLVSRLSADGVVPEGAKIYRRWELPVDRDPEPVVKIVEKIVEKRVEVPVEKIVEKRVEVPVEKIVEKRVEVPVEKIVEKRVEVPVEKIVVKEVVKVVEPAPRTPLVVPEVVEAVDAPPPRKMLGGIFRDADPQRLAALEAAARRELSAAAAKRGFRFGSIFGGMRK